MKTLVALGIARGFLLVVRGWISMSLILRVAGRFLRREVLRDHVGRHRSGKPAVWRALEDQAR